MTTFPATTSAVSTAPLGAVTGAGGSKAPTVGADVLRAANKVLENYVSSMQRRLWTDEQMPIEQQMEAATASVGRAAEAGGT